MIPYTKYGVTMLIRENDPDDPKSLDEVMTYDWGDEPIRTFIDIGAHIGAATCLVKSRWPDALCVAVEPDQSNYDVLRANCKAVNAVALCGFVGDGPGYLVSHPDHSTCHKVESAGDPDRFVGVGLRLDHLMNIVKSTGVDICKLDCEGCELDFFAYTPKVVLNGVKRYVGEFHNGYTEFWSTIGDFLRELGYEVRAEIDPLAHATFVAIRKDV